MTDLEWQWQDKIVERIKNRALMEETGHRRKIPATNGSSVTGLKKITPRLIKNSNKKTLPLNFRFETAPSCC